MFKTEAIQPHTTLDVRGLRNQRPRVTLDVTHCILDASPHRNRTQVWLAFLLVVREKKTPFGMLCHTADRNYLAVHETDIGAHRERITLAIHLDDVIARCLTPR